MQSLWSGADAERMVERYAAEGVGRDLALHVYTSRLLGREPKLVLHGGGNTSRSRRSCRRFRYMRSIPSTVSRT
jgi:rhamnose utilization protein RhaD (predicted bifunctional aldolase and dehydrogenase)